METANGEAALPAAASDGEPGTEQDGSSQDGSPQRESAQHESPQYESPQGATPLYADGRMDGRRRRVGVLLAVAAAVYLLDMVSKVVVAATMHYGAPIRLLGSALQLDYTRNPGAAFSLGGTGYTIVFTLIAVGVVTVILRLARKLFSVRWAIALGLLLGGAVGNLTDRIVRAPGVFRGWVVDFIEVPHWPIFNLADSAICVGGALMVLLAFRGLHPDGTDERAAK